MTDRDLTPAEARAEVEAFMGEPWVCVLAFRPDGDDRFHVMAERDGLCLDAYGPTYRAAVSALMQAWRDAVRPWVEQAVNETRETVEVYGDAYWKWPETREEAIARVLKEDDK